MKELGPLGKQLLKAGKQVGPAAEDEERNLAALRARLAGTSPNPDSTQSPAPAPTTAAPKLPWQLISGLVVGAGIVAVLLMQVSGDRGDGPNPAEAIVVASLESSYRSSSPVANEPALDPGPTEDETESLPVDPVPDRQTRPHKGHSGAVPPPKPSARSGSLSEEVALLSKALDALHAGRPGEALATLEEHEKRFPRGGLALERRAARVQALCKLGREKTARVELDRLPQATHAVERAKSECGFE